MQCMQAKGIIYAAASLVWFFYPCVHASTGKGKVRQPIKELGEGEGRP